MNLYHLPIVAQAIAARQQYHALVAELVSDVVCCYNQARERSEPYSADLLDAWLAVCVADTAISQCIKEALVEAGFVGV